MLDLESLLQPIDESAPSGPDLEYDADFQELERLSQGKAEQQFGDTIIPAEEPEWRDVAKRAEALSVLNNFTSTLGDQKFLRGNTPQLIDIASFPFVRQFAFRILGDNDFWPWWHYKLFFVLCCE